ncbi:transposable element Tcb1 transposase [Trichonephila clavipes]|nr:transposable element Tcb1 transposase [Trichonephila clavipes]
MANNQSVRRHLDAFTEVESLGEVGVVVVHEEPHPQMTGTLSYRPEETGGGWREKSLRHTTQATGRPISRFTVAEDCTVVVLICTTPCTVCVPLTPAHSEKGVLCGAGNTGIGGNNEWGRVLFTDESRFSLSSDSHRILIWRAWEAAIIPRTSLKGTGMEVAVFSFGGGIMLGSRTDLHLRRRRAARTLPPVTIQELRLALRQWAAMPQQLIDALILSMGRRCRAT